MTPELAPADELRAALRHGLTAAMKARDPEAMAALRTAIAAIDNAEAIAPPAGGLADAEGPGGEPSAAGGRIAGARGGAGSTEAARRRLGRGELDDILRDQVTEHAGEADRNDSLGHAEAAQRLRRRARTLEAYLR